MPNPARRTLRVKQKLTKRETRFKRRVKQSISWPSDKIVARRDRLTRSKKVVNGKEVQRVPLKNKLIRAGATEKMARNLILSPELNIDVKSNLKKRASRARFLSLYRKAPLTKIQQKFASLNDRASFLQRSLKRQHELDLKSGASHHTREYNRIKYHLEWVNEQIGLLQRIATLQSQLKSTKR